MPFLIRKYVVLKNGAFGIGYNVDDLLHYYIFVGFCSVQDIVL